MQKFGVLVLLVGVPLLLWNLRATPPPPPPITVPPTALSDFQTKIRELDPKFRLVLLAQEGDRPGEVKVRMTPAFHQGHYQERLQLAQALGQAWRGLARTPKGVVWLTDASGNIVGSSFEGGTRVDRY
jgi:hypothetical protein